MIHLIHGIHDTGTTPIEGLIPYLAPFPIAYPDYGWIAGLETRIVNPIIVGTLKPYVKNGDVLICHSNGCAIAYDLMNQLQGVTLGGAVFINAALEQNIVRPACCPFIVVYSNKGDTITEAAKLGAALGLTDPVWGEMGHAGYNGTDPMIPNVFCDQIPSMPIVSGHSDFFTKLDAWGPYLDNDLTARLAA